jgi:hypothetical protein
MSRKLNRICEYPVQRVNFRHENWGQFAIRGVVVGSEGCTNREHRRQLDNLSLATVRSVDSKDPRRFSVLIRYQQPKGHLIQNDTRNGPT